MRDVQSKGNTKNRVRTRKKQLCSESRPALRAARRALHSAACERTPRSWRPSKTPAAWQPLPALWSSTPSLALGVGVLTLRRYGGRERGKGGGPVCSKLSYTTRCARECTSRLSALQEFREFRAGENGLRLAKCFNLLVPRSLADVEILHDEVAGLVEGRLLVLVLLLLVERGVPGLLRGGLVALRGRLLLSFVRDVPVLLLDRSVRVLQEDFVGLLRVRLGLNGVHLQLLRIGDDLLQHAEDTPSAPRLLVLAEARRRRRAGLSQPLRRPHLKELLSVHGLEDVEGRREKLLRLTLIRHSRLEILILDLAILASALQLELHLRNLRLEHADALGQLGDGRRELCDLRFEIVDVAGLELLRSAVVVEARCAEVSVLDLVLLLLDELCHHIVNSHLYLLEGVEPHLLRYRGERRVAHLAGGLEEKLRGLFPVHLLEQARGRLDLDEIKGLRKGVVRIVGSEDRQGFANGLHLLLAHLLPLLPLRVRLLTRLLEVHQELLVRSQGISRVVEVHLRLREVLVRIGELLRLGVELRLPGLDLLLLRSLEVLVGGLVLHLLLLRRRKVGLKRLLHLLQDAEDFAGLRRIALLEGGLLVEIIPRRLHEQANRPALRGRDDLLQESLVLLELHVDHRADLEKRLL